MPPSLEPGQGRSWAGGGVEGRNNAIIVRTGSGEVAVGRGQLECRCSITNRALRICRVPRRRAEAGQKLSRAVPCEVPESRSSRTFRNCTPTRRGCRRYNPARRESTFKYYRWNEIVEIVVTSITRTRFNKNRQRQ